MSVWDEPGRVDQLKHLAAQHLSTSQIADKMGAGISRCAVIGKCKRLGIKLNKHGVGGGPRPRRNTGQKYYPKRTHPVMPAVMPSVDQDRPKPVPKGAPECLHVELLELKEKNCRWPYGVDHFTFCGHNNNGSSYCEFHDRLSRHAR